ncbi:hypothetical protein CspHIS471_0102850 [Cutaneotrichosporon sp. HIS471]|nr:hypothetical protein CspHIS471_0102850 [Cutaneotrichosporon sp. HIS471]
MSNPPRRPGAKKALWRRPLVILAVLIFLVLVGTVIVLSTVKAYFGVDPSVFLTEDDVPWRPEDAIMPLRDPAPVDASTESSISNTERDDDFGTILDGNVADADDATNAPPASTDTSASEDSEDWGLDGKGTGGYWMRKGWDGKVQDTHSWERLYNVTTREGEKIPRIIHQTWKSDVLPDKWRKSFRECREGMPDYEYMLWTDELAVEFIKKHYPAQLHMYENYPHPIQRADAIRYFILHHFGGIYMDLDIGCRRRMDQLLQGEWEVVLPVTKPVGVSNDLIFSSKGNAFMDDTVHGLAAFNHYYVMHYPTVMFSTGPMFLSAQLGMYSSAHPVTPTNPVRQVRVLPRSLYGKNAPQAEVPHSFFSHFYGSSWHANDAGFITWLGKWGKGLMYVGSVVLVVMVLRLIWTRMRRKNGPQYMMLPVFDDGTSSAPISPVSDTPPALGDALRRAGNMILAAPAALVHGPRRQKGWLYFVPWRHTPTHNRRRTASEASQLRRPHSASNSVSLGPVAYSDHPHAPPPPPYDAEMDAVDAFLKDNADDEVSSQVSGSASGSSATTARQRDEWREGKWGDWRND